MERGLSSYTGCLLGLAAGEGLGNGPETENGFLPTGSHTQMAAYACNGLLLGVTQGQLTGTMAPPVCYIAAALTEWARRQVPRGACGTVNCWISRSGRMDQRRCPEPQILDLLSCGRTGTMEDRAGALEGPGALMTAAAAGMFYDPERLSRREIQRLGAEGAALTHGDPGAFLSAAAFAHILSRILWDGETNGEKLCREAEAMLRRCFGREYHQARELAAGFKKVRTLARWRNQDREAVLEKIGSRTAAQVLTGALYLWMTMPRSTEAAVHTAAKWCGAGAAVVGAILGAANGEASIPGRWREALECGEVLRELAEDVFRGCPMMRGSRVFDIEWDEKYNSRDL